jgi:hypothetical protein
MVLVGNNQLISLDFGTTIIFHARKFNLPWGCKEDIMEYLLDNLGRGVSLGIKKRKVQEDAIFEVGIPGVGQRHMRGMDKGIIKNWHESGRLVALG